MRQFTTELAGLMAIHHRIIKTLKKKHNLRQRDWEILCACYMLSLAKYPFTAAKLNEYLAQSYFLPCLYNSINVLLDQAYITVFIEGRPFYAERYELTWKGRQLVKDYTEQMRRLSDEKEYQTTGKYARLW